MSNRPMSIKVIITTSITYFMIFATSALAVDYVYESFFTDITSSLNPVRYLTKYFICGLVSLYCMKREYYSPNCLFLSASYSSFSISPFSYMS